MAAANTKTGAGLPTMAGRLPGPLWATQSPRKFEASCGLQGLQWQSRVLSVSQDRHLFVDPGLLQLAVQDTS